MMAAATSSSTSSCIDALTGFERALLCRGADCCLQGFNLLLRRGSGVSGAAALELATSEVSGGFQATRKDDDDGKMQINPGTHSFSELA